MLYSLLLTNSKKIAMKFIISILFFLFVTAQTTTAQSPENEFSNDTAHVHSGSNYDNIKNTAELQYRILQAENELRMQKTYKYIFLAAGLFVLFLAIFTGFIFYARAKKTAELMELQNHEIFLRENRIKQLSVILDNVESPLVITKPDGEIQWLNRSFENFYGLNLESLKEGKKSNFITEIVSEEEKARINEALRAEKAVNYPVSAGKGRQFFRTVFPVPGNEGKIIGLSIVDNLTKPAK